MDRRHTTNTNTITRTLLLCTEGCADYGKHCFRETKHDAWSEKTGNKRGQSRRQGATMASALHTSNVSMTKACSANRVPTKAALYGRTFPTNSITGGLVTLSGHQYLQNLGRNKLFPPPPPPQIYK